MLADGILGVLSLGDTNGVCDANIEPDPVGITEMGKGVVVRTIADSVVDTSGSDKIVSLNVDVDEAAKLGVSDGAYDDGTHV